MVMVAEIDHHHFLPKDAGSITKRIDHRIENVGVQTIP